MLALLVGLRHGETLGLRREDLDVDGRTLLVRRSVQRVGGRLQLVAPKTASSRRPAPIPAAVLDALRRHSERQAEERAAAGEVWQDNGLVFTSTVSTLLESRNVSRRFDQLRDRAGLPWLRLHDLRHGCAAFLLAAGVEPRTVMEILGHATVRMTTETYGHVLPERLHAAADAIERLVGDQ